MAKLDLRQNGFTEVLINKGTSHVIFWDNIPNLDVDYTLTIESKNETHIYSVGNGLTLVPNTNTIAWSLNSSGFLDEKYIGYLESQSKISGLYLRIKVILKIDD